MKVCPKCSSSYTDETLNFCLADGSPLVEANVSTEKNWHEAETLSDNPFSASSNQHRTDPNSRSPETLLMTQAPTETFQIESKKSKKGIFVALAGIIILSIIGGFWWWNLQSSSKNTSAASNNQTSSNEPKKTIVQLSPAQDMQVKKEVTDFIESWRKTNEERDIEKHTAHYAETLDHFYKDSDVNRNKVRASRQQAYDLFPSMNLQVDKLKVTPESETEATAVFDKSWTFKNEKKTTTGSVQQEMRVAKKSGKWLIVGEKDLNVYFINNRLNESAENAANTANTNANK